MDEQLRKLERDAYNDHAAALKLIDALLRLRNETWGVVPCPNTSCPSPSRPCHTCSGKRFVRICVSELDEYTPTGRPTEFLYPASPSASEQVLASFPDLADAGFPENNTGVPHIVSSIQDPRLLQILAPPTGEPPGVNTAGYTVVGIYIQPEQYVTSGNEVAMSLEYDKASMEIPCPTGRVIAVHVVTGDIVQPGHPLFTMRVGN